MGVCLSGKKKQEKQDVSQTSIEDRTSVLSEDNNILTFTKAIKVYNLDIKYHIFEQRKK